MNAAYPDINLPIKQAFAPIIGQTPRVMILGSLPGDASLQQGQYYAHPRNQFWRLLSDISGLSLLNLTYPDKIIQMQRMPLMLWDVVEQAQRKGSLDGEIKHAQIRPLAEMIGQYPSMVTLWFNGQRAAKLAQSALTGIAISQRVLPSSSPAYTLPYEQKRQYWQQAWDELFGHPECNDEFD